MQRLIVTGPNGSGKSYLAAQLGAARPQVPIISFDAIKLTRNWQQRPKSQVEAELARIVQTDNWVIEGGPSLLPHAIKRADGVIWLDPAEWMRAWRLFVRPLRNIGRTRPELPAGNIDWPWDQYRFAMRSLKNRELFQSSILKQIEGANGLRVWHIRNTRDVASAINDWRRAAN